MKTTLKKQASVMMLILGLILCPASLMADSPEQVVLTVNVQGGGEVSIEPSGGTYPAGTDVTLTAIPGNGYKLSRWEGALSGRELTRTITLKEDTNVTALFLQTYIRRVIQNTNYGKVKGQQISYTNPDNPAGSYNSLIWKGLPYAKPPVGELRWRAPESPKAWQDIREALEPAEMASQIPMILGGSGIAGSEDCLYLDIYRPYTEEKDLPVYLWIHGGGNSQGSAATFDLASFSNQTNTVAVVIQYRLGELGFFSHPALETGGSPLEDSGNYGLLDQIKALEWVQENIEYFGGNPANVTIAGESAGGHNTLALLTAPQANGLFHKAMAQSIGPVFRPKEMARYMSAGYNEALGITAEMTKEEAAELLRSKTPAQLIAARTIDSFGAVIDGSVLADHPVNLIFAGNYNRAPVILGSNKDEGSLFLSWWFYPILVQFSEIYSQPIPDYSGLQPMVYSGIDIYTGYSDAYVNFPPVTAESMATYSKANSLYSRMWAASWVHPVARALREQQEEVYVYNFLWDGDEGSAYQEVFGAAHGDEIPFFHGGKDLDTWGTGVVYTAQNQPGRRALVSAMTGYVKAFCHTDAPNAPGLPTWENWSNYEGGVKALNLNADNADYLIDMGFTEETMPVLLEELELLSQEDPAAAFMVNESAKLLLFN